jgi:SPP1 gp7 family putative phage head morphogenesis protein
MVALNTGRAALTLRDVNADAQFGPGQPIEPTLIGFGERQFDYLPSTNTQILPRATEATSFDQLRSLADNCDVLRLVIETRKDQVAKIKWKIGPKDPDKSAKPDPTIQALQDWFAFPDGFNDFATWQRAILEDLFVLDAACVFPDMTGTKVNSFELIDGATIKRVIDLTGRTPTAPDPAYQQVIKGTNAANYTRDQLVYRPRNVRTNKIYGYGPVEQILMTINTLIRRSLTQLQAFTEGTVPDMIVGVPPDWNPDHIKQFQTYWDALLENNTALRAKARFVPGGMKPEQTKPNILSDMFDEWLARIVCFAFSISPQPFVKMMNKATAGTAQEQSLAEGLEPTKTWFKNFMDILIGKYMKRPDLEYQWDEEEAVDPLEQAQIAQIYVEALVLTPDEVREQLGKDPLTAAQKEELSPTPPPMMMPDGSAPAAKPADGLNPKPPNAAAPAPSGAAKPPAPANKLSKKKVLGKIDRNRKARQSSVASIDSVMKEAFAKQLPKVVKQLQAGLTKVSKTEDDPRKEVDTLLASLNLSDLEDVADDVGDALETLAKDAVAEAAYQVGAGTSGWTDDQLDQANEQAIEYARTRAAELVGKKINDDGELVDNPDASWAITDSTREMLRTDVTTAMEEGWSNDKLADAIGENEAFSDSRSEMIARTETAFADVEGNLAGWTASGVVSGKEWTADSECCDLCQALDGVVVDLDEDFPDDGGDGPPLHPNCECDVLPVVSDETNSDEGNDDDS